ncbi:filamentous hemagglutinin N-terminal domain-containing protein [Rhizobium sp. P38BS-XIX]|uniref:YDG domain-containing protein n=1 Tax=Rhizobium sp. P38BS-XIX TaxID=2726740 RepID=UPI0014569F47|nr:YDG domain-containing protein [Rhizobium sp. P38BS-XIX]NLR98049.1 filamentous hemagglutinin N-terminal domain-containing protein [Rhizobium sp. P38BS-XIX]
MTRQTTRMTLSHKTRSHQIRLVALLASTALVHSTAVLAQSLPTGGQVAAGSATIGSPSAGALTINQTSGSAVVNWQSFNVGKGNRVTFVQPDANAAILNRVTGQTTSTIAGQIKANGQVYLINPNGIAITKTGTVKAGGFVASTLGISDDDFMGGKRTFTGNGASAPVTNAGAITINRGGYMALIGGTVANTGTITVPMGKAALGSGEQATLDLSGDGFLQVAVPTKAGGKQALVENSGRIVARGGTVQLTAAAARDMARQAVNMSGTIEAKGVSGRSGDIILSGGDGEVEITGRLDASNRHGAGGKVQVTSRKITLANAKINASGKSGGGTVNIGGNRQGKGPLQRAETLTVDANTVINADAVNTGNGGNVVLWSDDLTRFAGTITAKGGALSGNGGEVEVSGKALLSYTGLTDLTATHGSFGNLLLDPYNVTISTGTDSNSSGFTASGNDSIINVNTLTNALATANVTVTTGSSSDATNPQAGTITVAAPINWSALTTLTLAAASDININSAITANGGLIVSAGSTNTISANAAVNVGAFVLASGNWVQNGATLPAFSAKDFRLTDGTSFLRVVGGNGASAATAYRLADVYGLQGLSSSLAAYWTLASDIDASGTAVWNNGAGFKPLSSFNGTLDGNSHTISGLSILSPGGNTGLFSTIGSSGTVKNLNLSDATVTGSGNYGGVLVGENDGTVSNVHVSGTLAGNGSSGVYGGLAGINYGTISSSYATGAVSGGSWVGGLVGANYASIDSSHASGAVSVLGDGEINTTGGGGLVGRNYSGATISNSSASGAVSGDNWAGIGGLVGQNDGLVTTSYATGVVTGGSVWAGGLVGENYGTIQYSYATGAVSGGAGEFGGLVGDHYGTIQCSYATGAVTGTGNDNVVGGLVGLTAGEIVNSYASGALSNTNSIYTGGLVGYADFGNGGGGNSWDIQTTGQSSAIGYHYVGSTTAIGLTTAQARTAAAYTGWDFTNIWYQTGDMRPILRSEAATVDGNGVITITNLHQLALMALAPSATYVLASDLDASETAGTNASGIWGANGWVSLANFAGTLGGNGHAISGLTSTTGGLFASTTSAATIHDLSLTNASISGTGAYTGILVNDNAGRITNVSTGGTVSGSQSAGGLAGQSSGAISGSSSSASVTANAGSGGTDYNAGGLVAILTASGTISQSYATGAVTSDLGGPGGLVGANYGAITLSYATGATSGIDGYNGGLVSYNQGTISNSYATGAVGDTYLTSGGLVALNRGTISTSYATGAVDASSGGSNGGFVGSNNGTISASFWDTQASGQSTGAAFGTGTGTGLTGLTTAQMQTPTNFINAGWDYGTTWGTLKTGGTPVLRALNTAPLISYCVVLSGNTSTTYGDGITSTSGITVGGDGASLVTVGWGSAINSSTNAGTYAYGDPNVLSLTYRGGAADDFFIDYGSGALTVNQRIVNLSGNQTYNGTTNVASGNLTLSNLANGETLTLSGLGQLASKNVGSNLVFSLGTLALGNSSGLASNYTLAGGADTITIGKALISSIGGIVAGNKTYDGSSAVTLDASGVVLNGMVAGDALTLGAGFSGLFSDANAGSNKTVTISGLSLTGTDAGNYMLASNTTTTLANISQRIVNLSGSRVYDGTTVLDHSMLTLSNLLGSETLTLSGAGSMGDKNAGNGKSVSLGSLVLGDGTNGGLASNYVLGSGTVDIARATISAISGITANGKTYDGSANATLNTNGVTFNGMVAGDALTLGAGFSGLFADANAGSSKAVTISGLSLAGADVGNYTLANTTASTLANIAQRVISLSGNRIYDGTTVLDHSMLTLSNLVGNETLTLSGTGSMGDKNAGNGKSVSLGSLVLGDGTNGGLASNYVLGSGTVDIAKATISTISGITANGKTYDGSANATLNTNGATFNGMVAGDALTLGAGFSGLFFDANAGSNKTVTISGLSLAGADAGNYTLANTTATTLANIAQRVISLSGNRIYDGTTALDHSIFALSNLVSGETLSLSGTGSMGDKNAGNGKSVSLGSLALGDGTGLASNYVLGTGTADIAKATITSIGGITASGKTYDGTINAALNTSGASFTGMVAGDVLTLGNGYAGAFADANAGSNKTVTVSGLSLAGADVGNYTLASSTATTLANIAQRVVSLSGSRTYNGSTDVAASIFTLSNLVGNERLTLSGAGSMGDKNAGNGKSVALSSLLLGDGTNGGLASNYTLAGGTYTVDIAKAAISSIGGITANGKTYDGSTNVTLSTAGAVFNGIATGDVLTLGNGITAQFSDANAGSNKTVTISGLSLGGPDAGNYTLANTTATTLANIAQRVISLSGNRIYDGTTSFDHSFLTLSNLIGNETLTLSGSGSIADKNAGIGKSLSLGSLLLGNGTNGGLASNYTLMGSSNTVDIGKATISAISGITANGRIYDGTTNATLNSNDATFTGMIAGDVLTLGNGLTGTFSDKNAGTGKLVSISGLSLSGADAGNYTLASTTATTFADIAKASLTLSGFAVSNKTYDGSVSAGISNAGTLGGIVANDTVTFGYGGATFSDKNAGSGKVVTLSGITLSGMDADNYTIASTATTTADIARATISSIGGITASSKTYDGSATATLDTGNATFTGMVTGDSLSLGSGWSGAFADANAGSGKVVTIAGLSLAGADAGNYTLANTTASTLATIGQRTISLSGSRSYDGTSALDHSILTLSNLVGNETLSLSGTGSMGDKNAGNGKSVSLGSLALGNGTGLASNYVLGSGTVDIAKAVVSSIGGITASGKTYDGSTNATLSTAGAVFNGMATGDVLTLGNGYAGAFADANAGLGKVVTISGLSLAGADAGNYTLADTSATALADIARRAITVTANGATRTYGDANPVFTYTVGGAGLVNSDSLSGALSTLADGTSNVGTYGITQGTLGNANYDISYSGADLTVTKRAITVAANNVSRAYGDANPLLTYTVGGAGLVNGDLLSGNLATSANGASNVGIYGIGQGSLAASGNYDLAFSGADLTVTRRAITVAANNQSRIYGDANPLLTYTIGGAGLVNGDLLSGNLATSANGASNVGIYGIGQSSLAASGNYDLSFTAGNLAVTPRAITVSANSASRSYGDQNPLLSYVATGLINGDSLTGALSTAANPASNVDSYAIDLGTLGNGNYTIGYTGANLTITSRLIDVIASNASRFTGAANPLFAYTIGGAGLANGDRLFGELVSAANPFSAPGNYAITRGSLTSSANYAMRFTDGVLTVNAAPSTPSGELASVIIPRSYQPDTTPPLPPAQSQSDPAFAGEGHGDGSRILISDPRFDGTVVCLGNGEACVVPRAAP